MRNRVMVRGALCFFLFLVLILPGGCRKEEAAAPAGTAESAAKAVPPPIVTVSSEIPTEVNEPLPGIEENLPYFDSFSWREFIALTWPARHEQGWVEGYKPFYRGVPDQTAKYGEVSGPVVFGTWKNDYEIFLPEGKEPARWDSFASPSPCVGPGTDFLPLTPYVTVLGSFNKYHGFNEAGRGVDTGPLVDQSQYYVRFQTAINQIEYQYIRSNKLYLRENLGSPEKPLKFPTTSIEIKAAWRIMDGVKPEQRKRFYVTNALVLNPVTGKCTPKDVGLVGLHIINKTGQFPNWVWSTFEQVDNVPAIADETPVSAGPYSFNNPSQAQVLSTVGKPIDKCNPPVEPPQTTPVLNPAPAQVIRRQPIAKSTQDTNKAFHNAIRAYRKSQGLEEASVWENYILTLTQWPTGGGKDTFPNKDIPQPAKNTANTTMETWFQNSKVTTCMNCHAGSQKDGDDFVYFLPLGAYPQPPPTDCTAVTAFTKVARTIPLAKGRHEPDGQDKVVESLRKYFAEHPPSNQ